MEEVREHVGRTRDEEHAQEAEHRDACGGALRSIARSIEKVVDLVVLREPSFERRPSEDHVEDDARQDDRRYQDLERDGVAPTMERPRRPYSKCAVEEAHVPVRLDGVGDARRVVGTELPDRVDLREGAEQRGDAG